MRNALQSAGARRQSWFRCSAVAAAVLGLCEATQAFPIDAGDPDIAVRWDNNLRYNLGVRAQKQDQNILNNSTFDESDGKFARGDVVLNRLDVLSEFDVAYKKSHGVRFSASLWYDHAYRDHQTKPNPAYTLPVFGDISGAYPNNEYTDFVNRWNNGPSGEWLDAFAFTRFELGSVPVNLKIGQHTTYWGESLFSFVHGVSYSQGPIDVRKALSNPGVEAKEVFKPLPQISGTAQLTETMSLAGQYYFGWRPSPLPDGGTYFGVLDAITLGGGTFVLNPAAAAATSAQLTQAAGSPIPVAAVPFIPSYGDPKESGDWGLMARWSPAWLDGTAGFYYRRYTDKLPQLVAADFQAAPLALGVRIPTSFGLSFLDQRVTLVGMSLAKQIAGLSVGAEVVHRANTGLLMGSNTTLGAEPVGDTWHALVNAISYVGKTAVFDSAVVTTELTYSRLDKIKRNEQNFNAVDFPSCTAQEELGCATNDAWGLALRLEPKWFQMMAGGDLSMPMTLIYGLKGTSPVLFGGYEGGGSYSIGFALDLDAKYNFNLSYNGSYARRINTVSPASQNLPAVQDIGGLGAQWDRGWISFTAKATF